MSWMNKYFCRLFLIAFVFLIFSQEVCAQTSQVHAEKDWTFLIYMNGHNNLSSYTDMNIIDMEKVGSTPNLNILVEWGSSSAVTKRLYIEKSDDPSRVTSPSLKNMTKHDMGNYKNLQSFIEWGVKNYPAKHYFIAIWNHGRGWHKSLINWNFIVKPTDISLDDHFGSHITTEQVGAVMASTKKIIGRNIDIYGSDACRMQMIEVAGEMKGSVDYFVGSQETEPGTGWPYLPFLSKWTDAPNMTAKEISILLSKEYADAYNGGIYGYASEVTFAAWDMSQLNNIYSSLSQLRKVLVSLNTSQRKKIKAAAEVTTHFSTKQDYSDLGDFIRNVRQITPLPVDVKKLDQVEEDIKNLVLTTDNNQYTYPHATGISIWLPTQSNIYQTRYNKLKFSVATGWNQLTRLLAQ